MEQIVGAEMISDVDILAYLSLPLEEQLFKREFFQPLHRREGSLWIDQSSPGFGMTSFAGWSPRQS
jgi:hypothetical protein